MANRPVPIRRGVPKSVTLDDEAAAFLVEMAPQKTQGRFLSALLRAEHARQEERKRLKAGIERVFAETMP